MPKMPQMDLIAELKKRQVKPQVREGKDGALEDIITGTVTQFILELSHWDTSSMLHVWHVHAVEILPSSHYACPFAASDLRNSPYRRTDGRRPAQRQETWATFGLLANATGTTLKHTDKRACFKMFCIKYIEIYNEPHAMLCCQHCSVNFLCKYEVGIICNF